MLNKYLQEITDIEKRGDAREESYYSSLKKLIEAIAEEQKKKNVVVTSQPKATEAGNPDFRVWDGAQRIIGYIEAKNPGSNLSHIEDTEQLQRYLKAFPNVILTNFYEFWLYRDGNLIEKVEVAFHSIGKNLQTKSPAKDEDKFKDLLEIFFSYSQPKLYNAQDLAKTLAKKTRHLEKIVLDILEKEAEKKSDIYGFYGAFKEYLISDLDFKQFSDLYAQTITYGLFAARSRTEKEFTRKIAFENIPQTIGILRTLFQSISLEEPHPDIEWIVDDIASVLAVADIKKIMETFYKEGKGIDPIIHFYESFLAEYDPKLREKRGVYYTPEPVVSFIVRSVNQILKDEFDKSDGLADKTVTVLDPAAGTLTFIAHAFNLAMKEFVEKYGKGGKKEFIKKHLLKNYYAFELMMAPYAIGHLKMGFVLEEMGYKLKTNERFNLFLTNTLEMEDLQTISIPGIGKSLSEESKQAGKIKKEQPVLVIIGNPPYSGHSENKSEKMIHVKKGNRYTSHYEISNENGKSSLLPVTKKSGKSSDKKIKTWIGEQIENFKIIDGKWLGEKNPKWLQDDYVKFLRFAQWKIDKLGEGIVGMITNHGYLDNPTFRGMRQSLMNSFDQIYILDLHGNYKKKEKAPDGSKDENVFDITQGVSIVFLIRKKGLKKKISRADLFGLREYKYNYLFENDIKKLKWKNIQPSSDSYLFKIVDRKQKEIYDKFMPVPDIFKVNSVGIVTARDSFVIDFDKKNLLRKISSLKDQKLNDEFIKEAYSLKENKNWKLDQARQKLCKDKEYKNEITELDYRPFDKRFIFYADYFIERTRREVMQHMLKDNLGLLICRQQCNEGFFHTFVSNNITESCVVSNRTKEINYLFPLYLYPDENKNDLFAVTEKTNGKKTNIDISFYKKLSQNYQKRLSPENILNYVYAVMYSNVYRKKYAEFLKIDFPKIPFTTDFEIFKQFSKFGKILIELHLLKSKILDKPISKFEGTGSNRLGKTKKECRNYKSDEKRVYVNNEMQYFDGIEQEVWEYQIGGYQVLDKWLDSHKERKLSLDDIQHFSKVVTSLSITIKVQKRIDELYSQVEKEIMKFD